MRLVLCAVLLAWPACAQQSNLDQLFRSAVEAQQRGDLDLAVREYQHLLQLSPKLFDARVNLAVALVHLGRFDEAIENYRAALALQPGNRAVQLNLGLAYYKKRDLAGAIQEFSSLQASAPKDPRIATLLGDCYLKRGENQQVIQILTPLAEAHAGDMDLAYVLASALINIGHWRSGAPLMEKVAKSGNSPDAYLLAGKARLKLNQFPLALADLSAAAHLNPNLPGLYTPLGIAKEQTSDAQGAEQDLRKALASNPNDFDANLHLGGILYERRELAEARTYIDHAVSIDPGSLFALYERALCESASDQLAAAVTDLEKVTQGDPRWLQAHIELAALYYKLHRPADGQRERQIVDRLTAEQQQQGPPRPPSP